MDSLNWEKTANLSTADWSLLSFVFNSTFINNHFVSDSITKLSYLDSVLLNAGCASSTSQTLYTAFFADYAMHLNSNYSALVALLQTEYQDLTTLTFVNSPELFSVLSDYTVQYFTNSSVAQLPTAMNDSYVSNLNFFVTEGMVSFMLFFFYVWFLVYFVAISVSLK